MLYPIKNVAQKRGDPPRLWFTDHDIDLVVWVDKARRVSAFELSYDKGRISSRAIYWRHGIGFLHLKVDEGDVAGYLSKQTPIMLPNGKFDNVKIRKLFLDSSGKLDRALVDFVAAKLEAFPNDPQIAPPSCRVP